MHRNSMLPAVACDWPQVWHLCQGHLQHPLGTSVSPRHSKWYTYNTSVSESSLGYVNPWRVTLGQASHSSNSPPSPHRKQSSSVCICHRNHHTHTSTQCLTLARFRFDSSITGSNLDASLRTLGRSSMSICRFQSIIRYEEPRPKEATGPP